jgi:hypothetical protein
VTAESRAASQPDDGPERLCERPSLAAALLAVVVGIGAMLEVAARRRRE